MNVVPYNNIDITNFLSITLSKEVYVKLTYYYEPIIYLQMKMDTLSVLT